MPNWKKIITSGSDAALNTLNVTNGITGSLLGTSSYAATSSYATNFTVEDTLTLNETLTDRATVLSTIVGSNNLFTTATGSYTAGFLKYTLYKNWYFVNINKIR